MKANQFNLILIALGITAVNLAFVQPSSAEPSSLYAPPDAKQYLPYGVATPKITGTLANGTTFDYRNDRKRVAHFWKTYAHHIFPVSSALAEQYGNNYVSTAWNIPSNWTGNVNTCVSGTVSPGIQEATIRQANWYRAMAGVETPLLNSTIADQASAQLAALVNRSGFTKGLGFSHNPTAAYPCYTPDAATAASRSLLDYIGNFNQRGPGSIDTYMDDPGTENYFAGHRQATIMAALSTAAYGEATTGPGLYGPASRDGVASFTLGAQGGRPVTRDVLWPSAGYVPIQAYPMVSNRWSMGCMDCDFSTATVKATRNGAAQPTRLEVLRSYTIPTLIWEMQGLSYFQDLSAGLGYRIQDDVFDVTITYTQNGQPKTKTYRTTLFNPEIDVDYAPPFDITDLYWVPTESGWGAKLIQATDGGVFGAVYFYDDAGNPRWMTIQGGWTGAGVFSGKLYTTRGPGFNAAPFNPALVQVQEAGTGTLTFAADTQSMRFDFTMGNQVGSKQMVRFSDIPEGYRDGSNFRGLWWNANESGWGLTMQHYYNNLFVAWFTYNPDGSQVWVTLQGSWTSATTYEGKLYQTKQAPWNPASFNSNATQVLVVGTAKLNFTDTNRATFNYTMNGVTGNKLIEKFEF